MQVNTLPEEMISVLNGHKLDTKSFLDVHLDGFSWTITFLVAEDGDGFPFRVMSQDVKTNLLFLVAYLERKRQEISLQVFWDLHSLKKDHWTMKTLVVDVDDIQKLLFQKKLVKKIN